MSGRKESVKRARDPQTGKRLLKSERFNFFMILFNKGLKFSIMGIFPLLLQRQI